MNDPSPVLQRLGAALSSANRDAVLACFAADATVELISGEGRVMMTNDGIREKVDALLVGFGHIKLTPISRQVSASQIVEESVISGDHTGTFAGAQPTSGRVRVNVKLSATVDSDSNLQSLWVEADTSALFAQIAGTDDVIGVTGGLIATARERHEGAVRIIDSVGSPAAPAASREPTPRPSWSRRLGTALLVGAALLLFVFVVARVGPSGPSFDAVADHSTGSPATTSSPAATPSRLARARVPAPTAASLKALPAIKVAAPKSVPRVQPGKQVVLNSDVLFSLDSAALTSSSRTALNRVAEQVRRAGLTGTIQVNGYTDNSGSVAYDAALSRARAMAVAGVLQKGLAGRPITLAPQGFGQANPIAPNTSALGQARNRRVTIVLPTPR